MALRGKMISSLLNSDNTGKRITNEEKAIAKNKASNANSGRAGAISQLKRRGLPTTEANISGLIKGKKI